MSSIDPCAPRGLARLARLALLARLAMAASLVPLLAACAAALAPVHLPRKPARQEPVVVSRPQRLTAHQQVVAAYTGYTAAMAAAFASRSTARVSEILRPYLGTATIRNAIRTFSRAWAAGEVSYGQVVQHIISVRIDGSAAWVHDCDNTSGAGLEYARTGQAVPGTRGVPDDNLVTRLNLVHGHWMVWAQTVEALPCRP